MREGNLNMSTFSLFHKVCRGEKGHINPFSNSAAPSINQASLWSETVLCVTLRSEYIHNWPHKSVQLDTQFAVSNTAGYLLMYTWG